MFKSLGQIGCCVQDIRGNDKIVMPCRETLLDGILGNVQYIVADSRTVMKPFFGIDEKARRDIGVGVLPIELLRALTPPCVCSWVGDRR
jgi:hypothetical protein